MRRSIGILAAVDGVCLLLCAVSYGRDVGRLLTIFVFLCILSATAAWDMRCMRIENASCLAVLGVSLVSLATMPELTVIGRVMGFFCVSAPMLLLSILFSGAFGGGDIRLMAVCGWFLGWRLILVSALTALLLGGLYAGAALVLGRRKPGDFFPFGPCLCLGMAVSLFWGETLIAWYWTGW